MGKNRLVRVGFARDPTFTLVVDRGDESRVRDDGGRVGELDVRGAPDETLDLESGCEGTLATRGISPAENLRRVIKYVSLFPPGSDTVKVACPFCLTVNTDVSDVFDQESKNDTHH